MSSPPPYIEETFGILTDDDLYLDCVLIKPANASDKDLKVLRAWVPKYPLTKTSVISCARQEVTSYGADGKIAHLVFDLRGSGESDGILGDQNFALDLGAIASWADERFGSIDFGFLGYPTMAEFAKVNLWPLRAGAVMETYLYKAAGTEVIHDSIIYMSTYGNFSQKDERICIALADAGYDVYGMDPLRYLLHANKNQKLTPEILSSDLKELIEMLPGRPIIVGQPLAAGLALTWAIDVEAVPGVIAIGDCQAGLSLNHVFDHSNPLTLQINRRVGTLAPRPAAFVVPSGSRRRNQIEKELQVLYDCTKSPRKIEFAEEVTAELLLQLLDWVKTHQS